MFSTQKSGYRKVIVYVLLIVVTGTILYVLFQGPATIGDKPDDFVGYWAAGRLIAYQQNPYSLENLVKTNQLLNFDTNVLLPVFYPPIILPLFIPFGLIPYQISRVLWLLFSISSLFACGIWLWRLYKGPKQNWWVVIFCIFSFAPIYLSLIEGQITFIILIGIIGFLFYLERDMNLLAGFFLALLAIKFQLIYLIWVVIFLWIIQHKQWNVLVGIITLGALLLGITHILRPAIINEYISLIIMHAPSHCGYCSLSAVLCLLTGDEFGWVRYLPAVLGTIWGSIYFLRNRDDWIWKDRISLILFISLLTAPLTWMHDQILFLIPIIEIATMMVEMKYGRTNHVIILIFVIVNIVAVGLIKDYRFQQFVFIWMPFTLMMLYLYSKSYFSKIRLIEIPD